MTRNLNPTWIQDNNESRRSTRNPSLITIHDVARNPNPKRIQDVIRNHNCHTSSHVARDGHLKTNHPTNHFIKTNYIVFEITFAKELKIIF